MLRKIPRSSLGNLLGRRMQRQTTLYGGKNVHINYCYGTICTLNVRVLCMCVWLCLHTHSQWSWMWFCESLLRQTEWQSGSSILWCVYMFCIVKWSYPCLLLFPLPLIRTSMYPHRCALIQQISPHNVRFFNILKLYTEKEEESGRNGSLFWWSWSVIRGELIGGSPLPQ